MSPVVFVLKKTFKDLKRNFKKCLSSVEVMKIKVNSIKNSFPMALVPFYESRSHYKIKLPKCNNATGEKQNVTNVS